MLPQNSLQQQHTSQVTGHRDDEETVYRCGLDVDVGISNREFKVSRWVFRARTVEMKKRSAVFRDDPIRWIVDPVPGHQGVLCLATSLHRMVVISRLASLSCPGGVVSLKAQ